VLAQSTNIKIVFGKAYFIFSTVKILANY